MLLQAVVLPRHFWLWHPAGRRSNTCGPATSCLRPGVAQILLIDDDGFYRGLLRQILEDVRILAVSGVATFDNAEGLESAKAVGANAILSKLSPLDAILQVIDRILDGPAT